MTAKKKRQFDAIVRREMARGFSRAEAQQIAVEALKLTRKANRAVAHLGVGYPSAREGGGLDIVKKLKRALRAATNADKLAEKAFMDTYDVVYVLESSGKMTGSLELERLNKADENLSRARGWLGDTVFQIEKVLQKVGGR